MNPKLKLYHWEAGTYNYLVMSETVSDARKVLLGQIDSPGGEQAKALGHAVIINGEPTFVADEDYPIVLWYQRRNQNVAQRTTWD